MANAWIYQDDKQVKERGAAAASWYVGWYNPEGKRRCKSCGPGEQGKRIAEKLRRKTEAELMTGTYREKIRTNWETFRQEYESGVLAGQSARTKEETRAALDHFQRLVKPARVFAITTSCIDQFVAARRCERGKKRNSLVSPATINKELRHLRAVLQVAHEWGHLPQLPKLRMEKEPKKLPRYVLPDHFAAIYAACEHADEPKRMAYPAADWWRGLIAFGYMTGWRVGQILELRRDDLDLEAGTAITRWQVEGNKGKRDALVALHPVLVEHLKKLPGFGPTVFPWPHAKTHLYDCFAAIQEAAGIKLPCHEGHEHTPACHVYGFHDLRRAFATMNADKLTPDALQALMQHRSYSTTQRYINIARQMDAAVAGLFVPEVLQRESV